MFWLGHGFELCGFWAWVMVVLVWDGMRGAELGSGFGVWVWFDSIRFDSVLGLEGLVTVVYCGFVL